MSLDRSGLSADEYYMTALHIFDYCGAESTGTLRVDALMDKFAPFVKTNKTEYSNLKSLLDPDEDNPEISVSMLAKTLHKYSEKENQKPKLDLDESFNLLKSGQAPQDSDSGISTDGFQLLEELQCELREKAHLAQQLRSQLDFTDRQHEEALAALCAERDSLRTHLNMLREENMSLSHVRRDYEEVCERLCASDRALDEARRDLDAHRRRNKVMVEQVASLENEKLTLQELLSKSKAECHRINELYSARQAALREHNELLRAERADLAASLADQEDFVQQLIKEKVLLEMELKDLLNKSNQTQLRMDRSIDISYTEDQMLTALDSLNADSKFSQDNRILDEESFINVLKEDQGRATNLSLFDEIRLSFCNMSRLNNSGINSITCDKYLDLYAGDKVLDNSFVVAGTQTEFDTPDQDLKPYCDRDKAEIEKSFTTVEIQTDFDSSDQELEAYCDNNKAYIEISFKTIGIQTKFKPSDHKIEPYCECNTFNNHNTVGIQTDFEPCNIASHDQSQKMSFKTTGMQTDSDSYYDSNKIKSCVAIHTQTERFEIVCNEIVKAEYTTVAVQTENELNEPCNKVQTLKTIDTQTDLDTTNNNINQSKCLECEKISKYTAKLERDVHISRRTLSEMQMELNRCEGNLDILQKFVDEGNERNSLSEAIIKSLEGKIGILEAACAKQKQMIDSLAKDDLVQKNIIDIASVSTQADIPCVDCERRSAVVPRRSLKKFLWAPLKCLFQLFAVVCFLCAVSVLYSVSSRARPHCAGARPAGLLPWRWLDAQEILDLLLRIEYVADVPM